MLLAFRPLLGKSRVSKYLMIGPKSSESLWAFCKSVFAAHRGRVSWTSAQTSSTAFTGKVWLSETSGTDVVTDLSLYSNVAWTHCLGCAMRTDMFSWGSVVETSCWGRYDLRDSASATLFNFPGQRCTVKENPCRKRDHRAKRPADNFADWIHLRALWSE